MIKKSIVFNFVFFACCLSSEDVAQNTYTQPLTQQEILNFFNGFDKGFISDIFKRTISLKKERLFSEGSLGASWGPSMGNYLCQVEAMNTWYLNRFKKNQSQNKVSVRDFCWTYLAITTQKQYIFPKKNASREQFLGQKDQNLSVAQTTFKWKIRKIFAKEEIALLRNMMKKISSNKDLIKDINQNYELYPNQPEKEGYNLDTLDQFSTYLCFVECAQKGMPIELRITRMIKEKGEIRVQGTISLFYKNLNLQKEKIEERNRVIVYGYSLWDKDQKKITQKAFWNQESLDDFKEKFSQEVSLSDMILAIAAKCDQLQFQIPRQDPKYTSSTKESYLKWLKFANDTKWGVEKGLDTYEDYLKLGNKPIDLIHVYTFAP